MTKTKADQPFPIRVETRSAPASLAATHRGFTFYVARPTRSIHSCQFVVKPESLCHPKCRPDANLWLVANRRRVGGHTTIPRKRIRVHFCDNAPRKSLWFA